ncbi:DUF1016 domain-containing protein [Cryomorpha ignava]|uniref:DUF1016 domain-containing protein n=1 Tax=Cryomorpha ignava TaxID=101383 RepID=A0A7K3WMM9_9FLAO|nr:DUF1016 N-terminal domain-containing protein [Cryomorpha ignava]NEN22261.1 DUF1016 domain-containing protein [Cryomorpha ignava]
MKFTNLISVISETHSYLQAEAVNGLNSVWIRKLDTKAQAVLKNKELTFVNDCFQYNCNAGSVHYGRTLNRLLTARTWLIGFYIVEYEQNGEDRAKYGENLLKAIEENLTDQNDFVINQRRLREFRQFYLAYPQMWRSLSAILEVTSIWRSLTAISDEATNINILQLLTGEFENTK